MAGLDPVSNVASGVGSVATAVSSIFGLLKANPNIKVQGDVDLAQTELAGQISQVLAQIQVDASESTAKSVFVAGWRPFVGWVCGTALAYTYIFQPLGQFVFAALHRNVILPPVSLSELMPVLLGMLGLGAMRTVEKVSGAAGNAAH